MRGAERPGKVRWTRPFLSPLEPLCQDAARQTFFDITDASHDLTSVDKVLSMTDNMPLAISLIAHLVDSDGFLYVLSRWEEEKTSLLSDGYNKCSNLNLSISLSISSPRIASTPNSKHLLSLLAILPDGLSDTELIQSQLPFHHILDCKAALIRTGLAYIDGHKRLKVLVPIREYMQKIQPPTDHMIRPLLAHFQELLGFHKEYFGPQSNPVLIKQISSNLSNIPSVIRNGLCQGHPDLKNSVYCAVHFNSFNQQTGRGTIPLIDQILDILPKPCDHELEVYFITALFYSWSYRQISNSEELVSWGLEHLQHFDNKDIKCKLQLLIVA
jgi:hypothetical protein